MNNIEGLNRPVPDQKINSPSSQEKPLLINGTKELSLSQEGKLPAVERIAGIGSERFIQRAVKGGVRFGAAILLFASILLSPIDSPLKSVKAESNPQQANSLTLLHGDGSRDRLNILLLRYPGVTDKMLQDVAEEIFLIPPTNEFKERVNVYKKDPEEDLKCDQNANCDWGGALVREIDRVVSRGLIPHETLTIIKSNEQFRGAGGAGMPVRGGLPNIYTDSAVVRPVSIAPEFREFDAATVAHELWGHAFAGFDHEGGDVMAYPSVGNLFNSQHTQFLRDLMKLTPYNYLTPKNGIIPNAMGILSEGVFNSQQRSFSVAVSLPLGTKQLYSEIKPSDKEGDGQIISEYVNEPGLIHAWTEVGKRIPEKSLSAGKTYTWKICSAGSSLPLSAQGPNQDPRWETVEAWPGIFFPNPCAQINFNIPPYRILLPVAAK